MSKQYARLAATKLLVYSRQQLLFDEVEELVSALQPVAPAHRESRRSEVVDSACITTGVFDPDENELRDLPVGRELVGRVHSGEQICLAVENDRDGISRRRAA